MQMRIAVLVLALAALSPAASLSAPPPAALPPLVPGALAGISVTRAGPFLDVYYPDRAAAAPVLQLWWRAELAAALRRSGVFGAGPPLALDVQVMGLTLTGGTVTAFARYRLLPPETKAPLFQIDILSDAAVTSTYGIYPVTSSPRLLRDTWLIERAIRTNIADFVRRMRASRASFGYPTPVAARTAAPFRSG
jgi:hypothetical protein